jgi:Transposase
MCTVRVSISIMKSTYTVTRHGERYAAVHARPAEGLPAAAISRYPGPVRHTAGRFGRATSLEEVLVKATSRASIPGPFKPCLNQRSSAGATSAAVLHAELQARGWKGSAQAVGRYLRQFRPAGSDALQAGKAPEGNAAPAAPAPPRPRQVIRWIMTRPDRPGAADATRLAQITGRSPEVKAIAAHTREFAAVMTGRQGHRPGEWITSVRAGPLPALRSFASGLERDHAAVLAGLTLPSSSGAVEGQVCKIKYLKRKMYGRANFDLLRRMALRN